MTEAERLAMVAYAAISRRREERLGSAAICPWDRLPRVLRDDWLAVAEAVIAAGRSPLAEVTAALMERMSSGEPLGAEFEVDWESLYEP